jgi:SAM-dependent methyltransferase
VEQDRYVDQVLADYAELEPEGADSWNPVTSKFQLGYRLNLYYALARALQRCQRPLETLKVLDLGCGNGRSTRTYLAMGLDPQQLTGMDLRPAALARARQLNPAIEWMQHGGGDLPAGYNWISATAVFSSIARGQARRQAADRIAEALPVGGHVFYYDTRLANDFAGGDPIEPLGLFDGLTPIWRTRLGRFSALPFKERVRGALDTGMRGDPLTPSLREMVSDLIKPSVEALLLRKP